MPQYVDLDDFIKMGIKGIKKPVISLIYFATKRFTSERKDDILSWIFELPGMHPDREINENNQNMIASLLCGQPIFIICESEPEQDEISKTIRSEIILKTSAYNNLYMNQYDSIGLKR